MRLSAGEFRTKYGFTKPTPDGPSVIVYCRSGVRAGQAATLLIQQFGFTRYVDHLPRVVVGSTPGCVAIRLVTA